MKKSLLFFLAIATVLLSACSINSDKITHEPNEIRIGGYGTFTISNVSLLTYCTADSVVQYYGLYFSNYPYEQAGEASFSVEICLDKSLVAGDSLNTGHFYYPINSEGAKILRASYLCKENGVQTKKTGITSGELSVINIATRYIFDLKLQIDDSTIEAACDLGLSYKRPVIILGD